MRKESFNKFIVVIVLLIILTVLKRWFTYSIAVLWMGVLIGYYLPFFDHIFYAYLLRPHSEESKNIRSLIKPKKFWELVRYVNATKDQREKLIIHTAYFQIVLIFLTFYILTSSGSLFGRGIVYGFSLALLADEMLIYVKNRNLDSWFRDAPVKMDSQKTEVFLYVNGLAFLIFTIML